MITSRRGFLTVFAGLAAVPPWRNEWGEAPPRVAHDTAPSSATAPDWSSLQIPPEGSGSDDSWLELWQRQPRLPLRRDQIPGLGMARAEEWFVASLVHCRMAEGRPFAFFYHGGSEPGSHRNVLPVLLFTVSQPSAGADLKLEPVYLLAHCLKRNAVRTFRLSRMSL